MYPRRNSSKNPEYTPPVSTSSSFNPYLSSGSPVSSQTIPHSSSAPIYSPSSLASANLLPPTHQSTLAVSQPLLNNAPPPNKVAIPRLTAPSKPTERRRAARACEQCRQRKVKCDGKRPTCGQCIYNKKHCAYEDVKRVRNEKRIDELARQVERYENVLRDLEGEVDAPAAHKIRRTMRTKAKSEQHHEDKDDSESDSSIGSLHAMDEVGEDLNRNDSTRAAGFFGKNSEVSWMQRLEGEATKLARSRESSISPAISPFDSLPDPQLPDPLGKNKEVSIATMNYHLDDLTIPLLDHDLNPLALPHKSLADEYFDAYMSKVHPFFGAVRESTFVAQYKQSMGSSSPPRRKWLAILNMVFAIGCRHCRLMNPTSSDKYDDDLVFLSRARHLSLHENILFEHAELQQIQLECLVAIYLLSLGQLNRASKFSDMALHSALALAINLRSKDDTSPNGSKEARCRLWWSVYSLQHVITAMNGRASCVGENLCAVPLPIPAKEETFGDTDMKNIFEDQQLRDTLLGPTLLEKGDLLQSKGQSWAASVTPNPHLFFYYLVDLSFITQSVLNRVYSVEGVREGATKTEYQLERFTLCMDRWLHKLPNSYQFVASGAGPWRLNHVQLDDESLPFVRERVCLAMNYYSARITLCRPCLTPQVFQQDPVSSSLSATSSDPFRAKLRAEMTTHCLQAACSLISILPEKIDITWLARIAPWWNVLHFLMQATIALLLSLCYCSIPGPASASGLSSAQDPNHQHHFSNPVNPTLRREHLDTVIAQIRKALCWIHAMASIDPAAKRGFLLCDNIVQKPAAALKIDLRDWPTVASLGGATNERPRTRSEAMEDWIDFEGGVF